MAANFAVATVPVSTAGTESVSGSIPPIPVSVMQSACFGLTTAGDLVKKALLHILSEGSESELQADEYADGISALNDFMLGLEADGVRLGYNEVCNVSDIVTVPKGAIRGIAANLAIDLAPQYAAPVTASLVNLASTGMNTLEHLGVHVGEEELPTTLPMGSGNYHSTYGSQYFGQQALAHLSLAENRLETPVSVAGGAEKVRGVWRIERMKHLHADIGGRIINDGPKVTLNIDALLTVKASGATPTGMVAIAQSGVIRLYVTDALTTDQLQIPLKGTVELDRGQFLEVLVADVEGTANITMTDAVLKISSTGSDAWP